MFSLECGFTSRSVYLFQIATRVKFPQQQVERLLRHLRMVTCRLVLHSMLYIMSRHSNRDVRDSISRQSWASMIH